MHDIPGATVRIGHYQEPYNLEEIANDQDYTFMERGLPDAFAPSYQIGIMAYHPILDQRMTWWLGIFRPTDNPETLQDNGSGRKQRLQPVRQRLRRDRARDRAPVYEDNGDELLHLGASAAFRDPKSPVDFAAKPEMYLAGNFVNTSLGNRPVLQCQPGQTRERRIQRIHGPFALLSEVTAVQVNRPAPATATSTAAT